MSQDQLKQAAAQAVVNRILSHLDSESIIGIGTGSTADLFIDALARHKAEFDDAVASSEATAKRLKEYGIPVYELNTASKLEFYVDSADESNERLELIKGSDAALIHKKIVTAAAKTFTCVTDASKLAPILDQFPLPVKVTPVARGHIARQLAELGGDPIYREGVLVDSGNIILDVHNLHIDSPTELEGKINAVIGVVADSLFVARPADLLLLSTTDGIKTLKA